MSDQKKQDVPLAQAVNAEIKKIPEAYGENGFQYTLVRRDGEYAIYSQDKNGKILAYELVKVREYPNDYHFKDKKTGEILWTVKAGSERLPSTREWGMFGWTFLTIEECLSKIKKQEEMQNGDSE